MNDLVLVKSDSFGTVQCDFWRDENGEMWFTREQIGQALEYADAGDAIEVIHRRNKDRLDKFSVTVKLTAADRKVYNTTVYSQKGLNEVCRFSRQPKADDFMDWVWEVVESIRKHGMYAKDELLDNPDLMIEVLKELKKEREEKKCIQTENKLLSQQTLTWTNRKLLEAIVKAYGAHIGKINPELNGFVEAWHEFKKELLYAHGINLNLRITNHMNASGKKTKPKTMDMIHDDELPACISTAVSLCNTHGVDISEIIQKYKAA